MEFSYNWLQSYFDKPLPEPEKLVELLTFHSFEVEGVETRQTAKGSDCILDISILPNRVADCASHLGIAREISVFTETALSAAGSKPKTNSQLNTNDYVALEVEKPDLCPRYIALLVKGVKVGQSPEWLQERLSSAGQKSINNIVDAANYIMLETGQPLHAFDLAKIGKRKIVVRAAKEKEKIMTLDGKLVEVSLADLVIADGDGEALAIAGIKGGKKAEITEDTKDIIIEAATFNPVAIRKTSRRINLKTDASLRFEHGLSLFLPEMIMDKIARLVQEIAGGEVAANTIDFCPVKPEKTRIILNEKDTSKILGIEIEIKKMSAILEKLGFKVEEAGEGVLAVYPPNERTDMNIKEDLIEEIGRIYGYENITAKLPEEIKIKPEINEEYAYSNWIRGILADAGFSEVYNYSFWKEGKIEVENPKSPYTKYLKTFLRPRLVMNIEENFKNFETVRLFEIGKVFSPREDTHVAIAIADKKGKIDIKAELKGIAEKLFIDNAEIYMEENVRFDSRQAKQVFEIDLKLIIDAAKERGINPEKHPGFETEGFEYKPFSRYPAIVRDVSLFVPSDAHIEEVADKIENTGGELLMDTDLFDEYAPPGEDKKSLAFRLVFQSFDKTLKDEEVNAIMEKIIKALESNENWEVRRQVGTTE
ncbi:MAG: phenylalanine--tRNA ligase subunit beta [Candidatus Pacebacteria bacterium]|nr:phenylalanine--tRNA ligase subunit beta [Candidatus Paceibacterota bacterium]